MNPRLSVTTHVDEHLKQFFATRAAEAASSSPWLEQLWRLAGTRATGGKGVRPKLFLAAYECLLGSLAPHPAPSDPQPTPSVTNVLHVATAIELLHYSFLLHDDVIDGDTMRRGTTNLIGLLALSQDDAKLLHWGRSNAILMGNLLLAQVHQIFALLDLPPGKRERMLALLNHTITESVAGEQLDVGLSDGVIPAELTIILQMCAYKTATYTFEFPLRAAAVLADADIRLSPVLAQAGHCLGLAFQLQDDYLSTFGDAAEHGKDPFSDIREGKETAIIAYARMTSRWANIEPLFGRTDLTPPQGEQVRDLLADCGAQAFTQALIDDQVRALHELLSDHFGLIPTSLSTLLLDLAADLEGRTA